MITGGSQGTGLSLSILISSRGGNVVIIARNQAKLTAALSQISAAAREPGKQRFHAISADLSEHREVKRAFDEIREFCGGEGKAPDVVWQVAGGTRPGYFKDMSSERLEDEMKLNYFGAMHTAHVGFPCVLSLAGI